MRRSSIPLFAALCAFAIGFLGCGSKFPLPTENRADRIIPTDSSYQMQATWIGMNGVNDILLTQGTGTQLFILFNHGGSGKTQRGEINSYTLFGATGAPIQVDPNYVRPFASLFNPAALCSGGDGAGHTNNHIYVLDQGDSLIAYTNPITNVYGDTSGNWRTPVKQLLYHWRVREYGLRGGDTLSTFADTTIAWANGVAADAAGRVYVSGLSIRFVRLDEQHPSEVTRLFLWQIGRYIRGPQYPGRSFADIYMPGANWHRDTTWMVGEGNGTGTVIDPRGLYWTATGGGGGIYVADFRKNVVQEVSDVIPSAGLFRLNGGETDLLFEGPRDVTADLDGFLYVADTGNRRVLRYEGNGTFVQKVNIEADAFGDTLHNPVTVAADDSLVFVGDPTLGRVIRYERRR